MSFQQFAILLRSLGCTYISSAGVDADVINSIVDGGVGSKGGESSSRARNSGGSDVLQQLALRSDCANVLIIVITEFHRLQRFSRVRCGSSIISCISLTILFTCSFMSMASFVIDMIHWSRISFEWASCLAISARSSIFFVIVVV